MKYVVYALKEPPGIVPRYIGSTRNFKQRIRDHLSKASKVQSVRQWVQTLRIKGLKPIVEVLQECETHSEAMTAEGQWAMMFTQRGYRLLNKTIVSCPHCGEPVWFSLPEKMRKR